MRTTFVWQVHIDHSIDPFGFAHTQLVPAAQFQAQVFKLRQREYKYYAEAVNNASTAVVPVLPPSDGSSSGNNPAPTSQSQTKRPSQSTIPAVPDLADQGGLLNNPLYFNFMLYILWKAALAYLPDAQSRCVMNGCVIDGV